MTAIKNWWNHFTETHPSLSQWVREGGLYVIVSNAITVFKYLLLTFLPAAFAFLGSRLRGVFFGCTRIAGIHLVLAFVIADARGDACGNLRGTDFDDAIAEFLAFATRNGDADKRQKDTVCTEDLAKFTFVNI